MTADGVRPMAAGGPDRHGRDPGRSDPTFIDGLAGPVTAALPRPAGVA